MEKRRSRRKRFRVPIKYGIKTLEHNGFTTDISPHGIAIKTNRPYRPGSKVLICIEFEGEILLARGDVKWARQVPLSLVKHTKCGMEIKFSSFNKRFLTLLKKWYDETELEQESAP